MNELKQSRVLTPQEIERLHLKLGWHFVGNEKLEYEIYPEEGVIVIWKEIFGDLGLWAEVAQISASDLGELWYEFIKTKEEA